ncbi:MAG: tetratricopeptide repeat protein [Betaproteobacteria bacterium]
MPTSPRISPRPLAVAALAAFLAAPALAQTSALDALFERGDAAVIEREVQRLLAANPTEPTALMAAARLGIESGDEAKLDAGVAAAERCVAAAPKLADCQLWLGRVLGVKALNAGMLGGMRYASRVKAAFEQAVALAPDDLTARFDLNQFLLIAPGVAGGSVAAARRNTEDYAARQPARAEILRAQLDAYEEKSAAAQERLLRMPVPTDRAERDLWGQVLVAIGIGYAFAKPPQLDAARKLLETASARRPDDPQPRYWLGRVAQEQKRYDDARRHFEQATQAQPQWRTWWRLAQVQEALGEAAAALANYQRALGARPGAPEKIRKEIEERVAALKPR